MPPDGSRWEIAVNGEAVTATVNPREWLPAWVWGMVQLWRLFQGGMGIGPLPDPGGTMDQPCIMLDAFAVMSSIEAELREKR